MIKESAYTCGPDFLLLMKTGTYPIIVLYRVLPETKSYSLTFIQI